MLGLRYGLRLELHPVPVAAASLAWSMVRRGAVGVEAQPADGLISPHLYPYYYYY